MKTEKNYKRVRGNFDGRRFGTQMAEGKELSVKINDMQIVARKVGPNKYDVRIYHAGHRRGNIHRNMSGGDLSSLLNAYKTTAYKDRAFWSMV